MRVLLIDDGEVGRLGRSAALEICGHSCTAVGWADAGRIVAGGRSSEPFEVVLAALRPDRSAWDRYSMLSGLEATVGASSSKIDLVGLVWNGAVDNPLLGLRMARAGVGRVVEASSATCAADLDAIVSDRSRGRSPRPSAMELAYVGVGPGCDPGAVLAWVLDRAAADESGAAYLRAFEPGYVQSTCGLSRRQARYLRKRLSEEGHIRSCPSRTCGGPERDTSLPRWSEVVAVVNLCRGFDEGTRVGRPAQMATSAQTATKKPAPTGAYL